VEGLTPAVPRVPRTAAASGRVVKRILRLD
jgi:hypothetical protein